MSKKLLRSVVSILIFGVLSGCKPDSIELTLYTSDLEMAREGEIIEVPVTVAYSMMGKDDDNVFDQVIETVKPFVSNDTKFSKSKGAFGDNLVVETKISILNRESETLISKASNNLGYISVSAEDDWIIFTPSKKAGKKLDKKLREINMMIGFNLTPNNMKIRVASDSRESRKVISYATWVAKKPYLEFQTDINRRDEVQLHFKGSDGSIYSEITPRFILTSSN